MRDQRASGTCATNAKWLKPLQRDKIIRVAFAPAGTNRCGSDWHERNGGMGYRALGPLRADQVSGDEVIQIQRNGKTIVTLQDHLDARIRARVGCFLSRLPLNSKLRFTGKAAPGWMTLADAARCEGYIGR